MGFSETEISSETYRMSWNIHSKAGEEYHRENVICKGPEAGIAGPIWGSQRRQGVWNGGGNEAQSEGKLMGDG